jgi:HSP20 family protein
MLMLNRMSRVYPLSRMHQEMNQLFNTVFPDFTAAAPRTATPAMNVWEDDKAYFIEAELPGYHMDDLDVTVLGDAVTIKGKRPQNDAENATYLRRERVAGEFERTWTLPGEVLTDKVEASLKDGVLLVTLPKSPETQPRKIAVMSGS